MFPSEINSWRSEVSRQALDNVISTMSFPPTEKTFENGKVAWFSGSLSGFSNTIMGENYCVKKYPNSIARVIEKGTGRVGMAGPIPHVARSSDSKITNTTFVCYQKIMASFKEGQFSELAYVANQKNNLLPPSKQKPESFYDKEFLNKLIAEGRKQIRCPEGFSKVSEEHLLSNDYYGIECQTAPASMSQLCPKDSAPTGEHVGGNVEKTKSGGSITTLIYEASETCFKSECYQGTFEYKNNYCGACPKGTTFDPKETEQFYKKDKLASMLRPTMVLCKGPSSLKLRKSDATE